LTSPFACRSGGGGWWCIPWENGCESGTAFMIGLCPWIPLDPPFSPSKSLSKFLNSFTTQYWTHDLNICHLSLLIHGSVHIGKPPSINVSSVYACFHICAYTKVVVLKCAFMEVGLHICTLMYMRIYANHFHKYTFM